ncbi:MAG TPA: cadherin-like domain-containing protein, partial [Symbiobacteriaceae bacterium]|nr:cadherin-like domain-containing protein [Symbiobacteriaceae bacterium]
MNAVRLVASRTPVNLHVGEDITYAVRVENPNAASNCNASGVTATLTTPDGILHPLIEAPGISLAVGEQSQQFTITYTVRSQDIAANKVTATARAQGSVHVSEAQDDPFSSARALESTIYAPGLTLTNAAGSATAAVGDTVAFSMEICNTGNVTLNRVSVSDTLLGDLAAEFPASLAAGACATASPAYTVTGATPDPFTSDTTAIYADPLDHQDSQVVDSASSTVAVIVTNAPPVATDDTRRVNENRTLTVAAAGVLANDTDPDGDPLTATLVTGPANGTLTLNPDGSFTYTPGPNANGEDSFTYRAVSGGLNSSIATV